MAGYALLKLTDALIEAWFEGSSGELFREDYPKLAATTLSWLRCCSYGFYVLTPMSIMTLKSRSPGQRMATSRAARAPIRIRMRAGEVNKGVIEKEENWLGSPYYLADLDENSPKDGAGRFFFSADRWKAHKSSGRYLRHMSGATRDMTRDRDDRKYFIFTLFTNRSFQVANVQIHPASFSSDCHLFFDLHALSRDCHWSNGPAWVITPVNRNQQSFIRTELICVITSSRLSYRRLLWEVE